VPHWSREPTTNLSTINARAESIATSPAFRDGFRRRRCIFPVNGWYEWRTDAAGAKAAYAFGVAGEADAAVVGLAGVWDRWREPASKGEPNGVELQSAAIITTASLGVVREYHDRMPLVLPESMWGPWLAPTSDAGAVLGAAVAGMSGGDGVGADGARLVERVVARRVSSRVNSPRNDDPAVLEPWVAPEDGGGGEDVGGLFGGR
jgi:putative SOS response-associated peptidase YedK